jgi:DNA-binding Lrp family transcriptional regulator
MSWKNGDEEDASRIRELLQDGQEPITEIANRLGIGFRRAERLLNLLLATGDVEVLREGNGQQWRIS